jgi:hypothetical protein
LTLQTNFDAQAAAEQLRAKGPRAILALVNRMNSLMVRLQAHIVSEKLQGQVLHHRTGKLSNSIRVIEAHVDGTKLIAGVEGAGGPAWYGVLHETGGTFEVPAYTRRIGYNAKDEITRLLTHAGRVRKAVVRTQNVSVRAHSITFPERSFMRSSQQDMQGQITTEIQEAAGEGLKP